MKAIGDIEISSRVRNVRDMSSGVATGGMGAIAPPPHFCLDGARDFLKIAEKIGEGVVNLQRSRGRGKKFSLISPLL